MAVPDAVYHVTVFGTNSCGSGSASEPVRVDTTSPEPVTGIVLQEIGPFVELRNTGASSINLGGWQLYGSSGFEQRVAHGTRIDDLTFLRPGCSLLIGDSALEAGVPPEFRMPPSFGFSTSLALAMSNGRLVDQVGREPDGEAAYAPPFFEGTLLAPVASVRLSDTRSYSRAGADTGDNRLDFAIASPPTPMNLGACRGIPVAPFAVTGNVAGSSVTLMWQWMSGGVDVEGFQIEAGSASRLANLAVVRVPVSTRSMRFDAVPPGTYYVRIRSFVGGNQSAAPNDITVIVCGGPCVEPPGSVTQLTSQVNNREVRLSWNKPTTGAIPTGYVVEAGTQPGLADTAQFPTGSTATFVVVSSVPRGGYYVRVRATSGTTLGAPSTDIVVIVQ